MPSKLFGLVRLWVRLSLWGIVAYLFVLAASGGLAHAQTRVLLGDGVVHLTGPWKFHTGDNMAWAQPGFDDSSWGTMDLTPPPDSVNPDIGEAGFVPGWSARGYGGYSGYAWYRLRVNTQEAAQAADAALALKMPGDVEDAYQVYVNGQLIGHLGRFTGRGVDWRYSTPRVFPWPAIARNGPATIAIRVWMHPSTLQAPRAGGMHGPPVLGRASILGSLLELDRYAHDRLRTSSFVVAAILLLALLAAFVLYWLDRRESAYLWLGLACLNSMVFYVSILADSWIRPTSYLNWVQTLTFAAAIGFWVVFWGYWFRLDHLVRLHRVVWGLVLPLLVVAAVQQALYLNRTIPLEAASWIDGLNLALNILLAVLLLWVAYRGILKHPPEGWLALPAVLLMALARFQSPNLAYGRMIFHVNGIPVRLGQVAYALALILITVMLLRRFLKGQQERARIQTELQQARSVQEMLIPQRSVEVPCFTIETVYLSAGEVGGDFFQILPVKDGAVLIVVGDVSGKGLEAAMTVSTIVGALRNETSRRPVEVLVNLNRVLCGHVTGFVTCSATLLAEDGAMTIANAGHLSPYCNGKEMATNPGLPLGIVAEIDYAEARYQLAPGDRLTFVSDGVVEATNHKRELFGFDRTQAISTQPANSIAETARRFGQQDDISVVTIALAPAAVPV